MATPQDCAVSVAAESTFRTYSAPTRTYEFNSESLNFSKNVDQGKGLRSGSRVARAGRRVVTWADGQGDLDLDVLDKGMGILFDAALGSSTVTQIAATTAWQQVYTLGDTPKSLTVQKAIPDAGGTINYHTFLGCMVDGFDITSAGGQNVGAKFTFDIADYTTAQGGAALSYPTAPNEFHFGEGVLKVGGAVTLATTTALATSTGVTTLGIRDFSLSVKNKLAQDRYNYNNTVTVNGTTQTRKQKPTVGMREITGSFTAEYDQATLNTAFQNDTNIPLLLTFTGVNISGANFATFQIALPYVVLEEGVPMSNNGDLVTLSHKFSVLDGLVAAQPLQITYVSTDVAL